MEEFIQLISNVGFPIVACFFMAKQNQLLTQAVMELKITLTEINDRLEHLEGAIDVKDK